MKMDPAERKEQVLAVAAHVFAEKLSVIIDAVRESRKDEFYANGRGNYYDIFGPFYYSFTVGPGYFIVLDDADGGGIDRWQTR